MCYNCNGDKMKKAIIFISILVIIIISSSLLLLNNNLKEYSTNLFYMDTVINIKIYTKNENEAKQIFNDIEEIYKYYHNLTNRYDEDSELYKVNHMVEDNLLINKDLVYLINYSYEWYYKSNGLFNINMGNVIDVWKKYRESGEGVPSLEELSKSGSIDINNIELNDNRIKNNKQNIDLGAIIKGYVTSLAAKYLEDNGVKYYLINAGGNVAVGDAYNKDNYKVGIENPTDGTIYTVVYVKNMSVVSSGGYARYYEYNGKKYHHIIDPNTLFPANNMQSVTVITKDSALGDLLSTTLFLMPINEGMEYIKSYDAEAIWYGNDGTIIRSEGFDKYEQE